MNEVLHNTSEVVVIDQALIERLKSIALASPRRRSRICLHRSANAPTHEMIIAFHQASFMPPHRHPTHKSESYHVIEGAMDVVLFDNSGGVVQQFSLSAAGPAFAYRLDGPRWHMPLPKTEWLIYHEVYTGPFTKEIDVEFPTWAPQENDLVAVQNFLSKLN